MQHDKFSFVTIVYEEELEFLFLQARSFHLFCPCDLVFEIIVVDNSDKNISNNTKKKLLSAYGNHSDRVAFLTKKDFEPMPKVSGWKTQQILKLAVAQYVNTALYLVLDAKNHFVKRLTRRFLTTNDGLAQINSYSYETHPLRPYLERVLTYFDMDRDHHVLRFTPTVTPFMMYRSIAISLIAFVEHREGKKFASAFIDREFAEFPLYSAYLLYAYGDWRSHYNFHQVFCPVIWPDRTSSESIRSAIETVENNEIPFFSVHRRSILKIDSDARDHLTNFWAARGLFPNKTHAHKFYNRLRKKDIIYYYACRIGINKVVSRKIIKLLMSEVS